MSDKVLLAIMESFYSTGMVVPGSAEDDPETAVDFLKYLKGHDVVPEDDSLDAAWTEAEAALPEGWQLIGLEWAGSVTDYIGEPIPAAGEDWRASADALGLPEGDEAEDETCIVRGPTPAAALRALAAKLREG